MRIIIGIGHPKQVHFWKNIVKNLVAKGHEVNLLTNEKDITLRLLDTFEMNYEILGKHKKRTASKALNLIRFTIKSYVIAKRFKPDLLVAGEPSLAYVSRILGKQHITLTDTEHANTIRWLTYPFTDIICAPSCFKGNIPLEKHVEYEGYEELAYLHPNYFRPDEAVLKEFGLSKDERFIVIRFVSWEAMHDIGDSGLFDKNGLITQLKQYGKVLISSEKVLPHELEKYKIKGPIEKIHHLLFFADIYIGESAPMATESAILGTPSIFVSSSRRGYTDELEEKYGLLHTFSGENRQELALKKAVEILEDKNSKNEWSKKREKMLKDKIDVTNFMVDFIERYPESFYEYKKGRAK